MLPTMNRKLRLPGLFDDFFGSDWFNDRSNWDYSNVPAANISENKDSYEIELAAPGIDKKDIKIDLHNNVLTISSEKKTENERKENEYMRREFSYSSFSRSFSLPESVNADKIKADHTNGVLKIHIPKKAEAVEKGPRQISIS
jgi:HSP20 family protein